MSPTTAAAILAVWLLASGLLAVFFEIRCVQSGADIQRLLDEEAVAVEELRRAELELHRVRCPDRLEEELPDDLRHFRFPLPGPETESESGPEAEMETASLDDAADALVVGRDD